MKPMLRNEDYDEAVEQAVDDMGSLLSGRRFLGHFVGISLPVKANSLFENATVFLSISLA